MSKGDLPPSPPGTDSPTSQMSGIAAGDEQDDPPPYSAAAVQNAAYQRGPDGYNYRDQIMEQFHQSSMARGHEDEPLLKVPISEYTEDLEEGEVQEIHVTDMSSSSVEGGIRGNGAAPSKTLEHAGGVEDVYMGNNEQPHTPYEFMSEATDGASDPLSVARGSMSPSTATSVTTSGVKRSLEE
jgi:hypothetical protein